MQGKGVESNCAGVCEGGEEVRCRVSIAVLMEGTR